MAINNPFMKIIDNSIMFLESWIVGDKAVNIEGVGFFEATKFKNNYHFSKKSKQKIKSHKNK